LYAVTSSDVKSEFYYTTIMCPSKVVGVLVVNSKTYREKEI
jgi:hypothetical protein